MPAVVRKYLEVARITAGVRLAYLGSEVLANLGLVVVMILFSQLWAVTFAAAGSERIDGYSLPEMLWYLLAAEAIVLSLPPVHATIEAEVKTGELAVRLGKPCNYLGFHYAACLGHGLLRLAVVLVIGGVTTYALVGGLALAPAAIPALLAIYVTTQALHFCYGAVIGLAAFWIEDVSGLYFLLDRLKWVLGGFMLPVEVYPEPARSLVLALPFRHMIAGPASLVVHWSPEAALGLLAAQLAWLAVFVGICVGVYRLGVRRVDIHGG
jgi:ABC-2 type transport system permease protein